MLYAYVLSLCLLFIQLCTAQPLAPPTATATTLKILSWNIYMLPNRDMPIFTGQQARAAIIAALLNAENYDVIVFQEAFHDRAREILSDGLREKYPYQIGPANQRAGFLRTNSGVWMVSRVPIKMLREIEFDNCAGFDCLANKGALLIEGEKNGQPFQIIGTHLQAFNGEKRDAIRTQQYEQIRNELLQPFERDNVPQLLCGDFNTAKRSQRYVPMLEILNADDGSFSGSITYTDATDDYAPDDYTHDKRDVLDYILFRQKKSDVADKPRCKTTVTSKVKIFRTPWFFKGKKRRDLSDHCAVEAEVSIEPVPAAP